MEWEGLFGRTGLGISFLPPGLWERDGLSLVYGQDREEGDHKMGMFSFSVEAKRAFSSKEKI